MASEIGEHIVEVCIFSVQTLSAHAWFLAVNTCHAAHRQELSITDRITTNWFEFSDDFSDNWKILIEACKSLMKLKKNVISYEIFIKS